MGMYAKGLAAFNGGRNEMEKICVYSVMNDDYSGYSLCVSLALEWMGFGVTPLRYHMVERPKVNTNTKNMNTTLCLLGSVIKAQSDQT
jgi:hypothetical protein